MLQKFRKVQGVLVYVLILNLAVAFAKIVYGNLTGALSMSADGYHSLFDGTSNIVGLLEVLLQLILRIKNILTGTKNMKP